MTSRMFPSNLFVTSCFNLFDNLRDAVQTQLVDGLYIDLLQVVRFVREISLLMNFISCFTNISLDYVFERNLWMKSLVKKCR